MSISARVHVVPAHPYLRNLVKHNSRNPEKIYFRN
nr:MAG TPA: hypothetical protein [Caudoviricetes sp.]